MRQNLVRLAHNWDDGKMEYWARSEALALYWVCNPNTEVMCFGFYSIIPVFHYSMWAA